MKSLARQHDAAELLRRLRRVRPESPRRWGRMSAHQMVCHVGDAFRVATGEKHARDRTTWTSRTLIRWIVLYAPLRWPGGIHTTPEVDQEAGGTRPGAFAEDVANVEGLVEIVTSGSIDIAQQPHPLFGRLSRAACLRRGYPHMGLNARQYGA